MRQTPAWKTKSAVIIFPPLKKPNFQAQRSDGSPDADKSGEVLKKTPRINKKPKQNTQAASNKDYEAKRLANMDPELVKDMMERRRMLEIKKKEREWVKMSAKEKKDYLEKENKRKYEKTFREKAEKMREKVREQMQELKDEDSSSEDQLAQFDQQKAQRQEAMDNQREERE
jgi:ribosomal protein S30